MRDEAAAEGGFSAGWVGEVPVMHPRAKRAPRRGVWVRDAAGAILGWNADSRAT